MENTDFRIARLEEVQEETSDVSSYVFTVEDGQDFMFHPGQFNMIGLPGVEEAAISFSSLAVTGSRQFCHTIRRVGNVTRLLGAMELNQRALVRGPFGNGWPIEEISGKGVLIVAGGIGLAPLRPMLLHCLANRSRINNLALVYGARTPEDLVFRKELPGWKDRKDITTIYCVDQLKGECSLELGTGLVTQFIEELNLDYQNTLACVCGPEIMNRFVASGLLQLGCSENQIYVAMERRMRCGTGHCGHCQIGSRFVCRDGPVFRYSDIRRFPDTEL